MTFSEQQYGFKLRKRTTCVMFALRVLKYREDQKVRVGFKMDKDFKISTESDDKGED